MAHPGVVRRVLASLLPEVEGMGAGGEKMLEDLLKKERTRVVKRWFADILETYPEETARFLKGEKDPFANPVGAAIREGIEGLFEELLLETASENLSSFLDKVIRIRAVQDFTPSATVSFLFSFKESVREVLKREIVKHDLHEELVSFDSRIDCFALLAFDIYMKCREEIYELRAQEMRRSRDSAVRMMGGPPRPSEKARQGEKP